MDWHKDAFKSLTTIALSVFVSTLVARLVLDFAFIQIWVLAFLLVLFVLFLILTINSNWIGEKFWIRKMQKKFQKPLVGILKEEECENMDRGHAATSFLADDWNIALQRLHINTEIINIDQLTDKYAVVINPYGEVYPEREPISMTSFGKIKDYIGSGGIFVCAGGLAFYYCWDSRMHHSVILAKMLQSYFQIGNSSGQNVLVPRFSYPPEYSLIDNPLHDHFGVYVIGDFQAPSDAPNGLPIFQTTQSNEDIQYVGDLAQVGGSNQVQIYRSVLPITRCYIPFLRANIPNIGEVYPIAGVPYERGLLVLCGMNLVTDERINNLSLARIEFNKICSCITHLLEGMKIGTICSDWRNQR